VRVTAAGLDFHPDLISEAPGSPNLEIDIWPNSSSDPDWEPGFTVTESDCKKAQAANPNNLPGNCRLPM
jgi:hypothetical protein